MAIDVGGCPIGVGHDRGGRAWHHIVIVWHHIVIAGLTGNLLTGNLVGERCPIGVGHDEERGSGMTIVEEGHDGEEGSAWYHIVIAGLTGNLLTGNLEMEEMPDRSRA